MARDDPPAESQVTTDRERIEGWASEYDAVPVRRTRGGDERIDLVTETDRRDDDEELSWDEFQEAMERDDMVVVYREGEGGFSVMERQEMLEQPHVESDAIEDALLEGETVTATVTETTVVEQTVVEEATVESEVVDRQAVDRTAVDAELVSREVADCEVTDVADADELDVDYGMFEGGFQGDDLVDVVVEVDEAWSVTWEVIERLLIESRIVDTETTETETLESDVLEETIDVEGLQQTIIEGDMVDAGGDTTQVVESGSIESEFTEGDRIETTLYQRSTVEDEMSVRREFTGEIDDATTVRADTLSSQTIESAIAEDDDLEGIEFEADAADAGVVQGGETTASDADAIDAEMDDPGMDDAEMGDAGMDDAGVADAEAPEATATESATAAPTPTAEDEGKTVVDATGEEVGMVTEVEGSTIYVDPHPSLADRIRTALDWGSPDEDAYPLQADNIDDITDDEVRLTVEE